MRAGPPVWLLDLDNTLHDAGREIFPWINIAMTEYVSRRLALPTDEASALRVHYWRRYGATLLGLIRHHQIDPHEFLRETHPFGDLHRLVGPDHGLRDALRRLPGRKLVVTNGPRDYAAAVLRRLGLTPVLDGLVSVEDMRFAGRWRPKPSRRMLRLIIARLRVLPARCVLVEDSPENIASARALGLRTVLVAGHGHLGTHPSRRPRAGPARRAGLQLQSAVALPRAVSRLR